MTAKGQEQEKPNGRSTAAENEMRANRVARMLSTGAVRSEIVQYASKEWGVSARSADRYISKARELLRADWDIDRQQMVAELLSQVMSIQKEARKQQNMSVALGCVNTAARLSQVIT